jgi:hypothetical protein
MALLDLHVLTGIFLPAEPPLEKEDHLIAMNRRYVDLISFS